MDPFLVEQVPEHLLKQLVEKFKTGAEGGAFYRCNKYSKYFVGKVKPVWPLPSSKVDYCGIRYIRNVKVVKESCPVTSRLVRAGPGTSRGCRDGLSNAPLDYCKVEEVEISDTKSDYDFESVVLPEVKATGAIKKLRLSEKLSEKHTRELLEAAKPELLEINHLYDATSDVFSGIQHLQIKLGYNQLPAAQRVTENIFQVAQNRKTLTFLIRCEFSEKMIINFIEGWLRGRPTGTLERLIFYPDDLYLSTENVNALLEQVDKKLMTRYEQTERGFLIEGRRGRLPMEVEDTVDEYGYGNIVFDLS